MTNTAMPDRMRNDLAKWLVSAMESHMPSTQIRSKLVSTFGLTGDEAIIAETSVVDGILRAISGSKRNMPDVSTDPIAYEAFNLVWDTFNQNSFFDKRHTPNRRWLDWKEQQTYQPRD